jgi:hypothetical protein
MKNKKGMLGNLMGGFIVILIGVSLVPMISQEINNAISCNQTSSFFNMTSEYYGETDSFGGGGAEHFGGYDGKVVHKDFLSNLAVYKTDKSIINPDCKSLIEEGSASTILLGLVPYVFALVILLTGLALAFSGLRSAGLIGGNEF